MTGPVLPPRPEGQEPGVSALHALYREGATAEPSLSLDRRILDAARAELHGNGATKARRPTPWWKSWLPVTSVIAVAAVGLSVTWRVMDEQERHLREEMRAEQAEGERAARAVPAQRSAETQPSFDTQATQAPAAEKSRRADTAVVRDAPMGVLQPEAKQAQATLAAPTAPTAPAAMAPVLAEEAVKKGQRAETDQLWERRDARAAAEAAPAPAPKRQMGKLEAGELAAGARGEKEADSFAKPSVGAAVNSVAKSVAAPAAADAVTPEAWLKHIRELRAAGRSAEAAQSLVRFRARYPDVVLPDDLINLK